MNWTVESWNRTTDALLRKHYGIALDDTDLELAPDAVPDEEPFHAVNRCVRECELDRIDTSWTGPHLIGAVEQRAVLGDTK